MTTESQLIDQLFKQGSVISQQRECIRELVAIVTERQCTCGGSGDWHSDFCQRRQAAVDRANELLK